MRLTKKLKKAKQIVEEQEHYVKEDVLDEGD